MEINKLLDENNIDILWVTNAFNKRYLTNFTGTTCEVLLVKDKIIFITDGRYMTQIKTELDKDIDVYLISGEETYFDALIKFMKQYQNIGVEGNSLTYTSYLKYKDVLKEHNFISLDNVIEKLRLTKTKEEISKIKKAVEITDKTFSYIIDTIKVGMSEKQVKLLLENKQIELGAQGSSFDSIVAFGENTAKPHARASDRILKDNEIITLDFGCIYDGYCSDMTRTFFIGKEVNEKLVEIHSIVKEAMETQIKHIKSGVNCLDIDKVGRDIIANYGYGEYFMHGTGHGVGLEVHEEPYLNKYFDYILSEGNIITIEPGIYIEGIGGVRIEQDVLVTKDGCEVLNQSNTNPFLIN